jgi:membrane-associated protease RseP (regulator of RpoE activity)
MIAAAVGFGRFGFTRGDSMGRFTAWLACIALCVGNAAFAADTAGPSLGAALQAVDEELAAALGREPGGELVVGVSTESPALRDGIHPGDLITAVDGQPVTKDHPVVDHIRNSLAGVPVSFSVIREGQPLSLRVTLGLKTDRKPAFDTSYFETTAGTPGGDTGRHLMAGATLMSLTPAIAEPLGLAKTTAGAVVLAVEPGSSADEIGLQKKDVVYSVGGRRTPTALSAAESFAGEQAKGERPVLLLVERDGKRGFLALPPKPTGLRQKWGPYWKMAGQKVAYANDQWVEWLDWLDRGKVMNTFQHHPGQNGYNYKMTLQDDGTIVETDSKGKVITRRKPLSDTEIEYVSDTAKQRWTYQETDAGFQLSKSEIKRNGTLKPVASFLLRRIDEAEEKRLAAAYQQQQVALAQQQQAAQQAKQSRGGGGGLFGALGGAMLGAMAGGNTSQVVGAAMKGAAIVDPNAAALGSVGDSLITGNTASAGGMGGLANTGGGGGSYPTRPNALDGSPACSMMNQGNYRDVSLSGGNDVQLKTMCGQAFEYYHMYLNAIAQGYSEADANRTYAAHQGAAQNAISFYQNNR